LLEGYQATVDDDEVDMDLMQAVLTHLVQHALTGERHPSTPPAPGDHHASRKPAETGLGAVLVFLPGWEEISRCLEMMRAHPLLGNPGKVLALPLHSAIPTVDQRKVFRRPPAGVIKVILATNIAETSLTIDDVVYVVDSGKVREKTYDAYTGCSSLTSVWVSKASSRQRAGRAGRVRPGIAYHLFSSKRHTAMAEFAVPELLRVPLEELCLQIKLLHAQGSIPPPTVRSGSGEVVGTSGPPPVAPEISEFLRRAPQPPADHAVAAAVTALINLGALGVEEGGTGEWRGHGGGSREGAARHVVRCMRAQGRT